MALFNKTAVKREKKPQKLEAVVESEIGAHIEQLISHYKNRLLNETNLEQLTSMTAADMRISIGKLVNQFMSEERVVLPQHDRDILLKQIINESVGLGPLESLLSDEDVTEILVNGHKEVFIEKKGRLLRTNIVFRDENHLRHVIDRIVAPIGRRIDESSPMVDARLPDGSRVNAVIPPVSLDGTLVSIRKFRKEPFSLSTLMEFDSLDKKMKDFLHAVVASKMNVLISGGTGSGKTTLLNALSQSIPSGERVVTIEDSAELKLENANVVGLEARPANMEGKGEITIRQLVRNALRMRPDRIIVGEVRGAEAFDMLQAMNTGHEGSLTTVHANSPLDAVKRVEGMILMAGMELPSTIIREYIVSALNIIVQVDRLQDGKRKILSISEVVNDSDDNKVSLQEIYTFNRTGVGTYGNVQGTFEATGIIPDCMDRLTLYGHSVDRTIFKQKTAGEAP